MRITAIEVESLDLELQTALTVAYGSYPVLNYALLNMTRMTDCWAWGRHPQTQKLPAKRRPRSSQH